MEPFKNKLSAELVHCIAKHLAKHLPRFESARFCESILGELEQLELKQRAQLIADHLHEVLPTDFEQRAAVLRAMLHPDSTTLSEQRQPKQPAQEELSDENGIRSWGVMPLCMVVGQHGLDSFEAALQLLREMSSRFTAEFDVRFFMIADQARALAVMKTWLDDANPHVRRLVSEGTRPRLPWGAQLPNLIADPTPMIPLLTALRDDPSEYVRRSVANHLNDIAKDHPDLVAKIAADWLQEADKAREKLVRHACRTLIKQGHRATLNAFGLKAPQLLLQGLVLKSQSLQMGDSLHFEATLHSTAETAQTLVIDYVLQLRKANGRLAPKVFKWKQLQLAAGESRSIIKAHSFRPVTTRRYYAGEQQLSLRINGEDFGLVSFELALPTPEH